MSNVVLLRPYVPSGTLRAMARERRAAAVLALVGGKRSRYREWRLFRKQAEELEEQASKAEHWEAECELTRQAAGRILEKAERSGA